MADADPRRDVIDEVISNKHFLRNAWYVAGFSSELDDRPLLGRTMLNQQVLFFRDLSGQIAAIGDRCPHRFVPLHRGQLAGDTVRCGYHGLGFDRSGQCVHNPHSPGVIPRSLSVPAFPASEQGGLIWVWMGDAGAADEAAVPHYPSLDRDEFFVGEGYLHGRANYELMSDNILDLSHIEFLHPGLGTHAVSRAKVDVAKDGEEIVTTRRMVDEILPPGLARVYQTGTQRVHRSMEVRWHAAANMVLTVRIEPAEEGATWLRGSTTLHLFTPETEQSTHYFYVGSMRRESSTEELHGMFLKALGNAFLTEDKPMIDAQQELVGTRDIMDMKPALLPIDKAAVLARRALGGLISAQDPA